VINGRSEAPLHQAEKELGEAGVDVIAVAGSMEDDETPGRLAMPAVDRFGRIDIVVNTVGGTRFQGPPLSLDRAA
jgi:NAD(P)-dependent dehydrogenase (short-subunit alcohol dehydrogenase family)